MTSEQLFLETVLGGVDIRLVLGIGILDIVLPSVGVRWDRRVRKTPTRGWVVFVLGR